MTETDMPASPCPGCGAVNDGASGNGAPEQGDYSVCLYCGCVARFGDGLQLVPATSEELTALPAAVRDEIHRNRALVLLFVHAKGFPPFFPSRGGSA